MERTSTAPGPFLAKTAGVHTAARARCLLTGLILLLPATGGRAMSMGEIRVGSALGEPFVARIAVRLDENVLPQSQCFELAGTAQNHPALAAARLQLQARGTEHELVITTPAPVLDPIVDLSVKSSGCGIAFQRDYVVFLSPRTVEPAEPVAATAPMHVTPPQVAGPRPPATARTHPPRLPPPPTRTPAAKRSRTAAAASPPRFFALKLDYRLESIARLGDRHTHPRQTLALSPGLSDESRAAIAAAPRDTRGDAGQPSTAAPARPVPPPAAASRPSATTTDSPQLLLGPPPGDGQASPGGKVEAGGSGSGSSASGGAPARPAAGAESGTASTTPSSRHADGVPAHRAAAPAYRQILAPYNLLLVGMLLLLAAGIALWLKARAPARRPQGRNDIVLDTMPPAERFPGRTVPPAGERLTAPPATAATPPPAAPDETLGTLPPTAQEQPLAAEAILDLEPDAYLTDAMPDVGLELVNEGNSPLYETPEQVLELAEVMVAFGRQRQAVEALDGFVTRHPQTAVEPWLKLLELHQDVGERERFDATSSRLHQNFNVATPTWDAFSADARRQAASERTLESMPHIMARLTALWGTADALPFLERLLEDNRSGQRSGFSLPIVWDILFLRDILRIRTP